MRLKHDDIQPANINFQQDNSNMNLHAHAAALGIRPRTAAEVEAALVAAQVKRADLPLARLMLRAGRLTPAARAFVEQYLKARP